MVRNRLFHLLEATLEVLPAEPVPLGIEQTGPVNVNLIGHRRLLKTVRNLAMSSVGVTGVPMNKLASIVSTPSCRPLFRDLVSR